MKDLQGLPAETLFTNLKAVLITTPQRWNQLIENFPEEFLRRQPLPEEWSALECLQHLIDLDRMVFPARVNTLLAGENFPAFFPDQRGTALSDDISPKALAAEFEALRSANLKLVDTLSTADLERQSNHAELGWATLSNLLHEWGGHDLMHLVQAEQALMQPFIDGCGAWHGYFARHHARANANSISERQNISSGIPHENLAGYSRAVLVGDQVFVSGTTATDEHDRVVGGDAYEQSVFIFGKIERALNEAGATLEDVVRTRIYLADASLWEDASKAHAEFFGNVRPANTLIGGIEIIGDGYLVEIEVDAIVGAGA